MLSRVANSLYWMSRYIERADNTARLVDVSLQLSLDLQHFDEHTLDSHWLPVVQSAGDETLFSALHPIPTSDAVIEFLVFQTENTNSILSSVMLARENARMVRDQIPNEFWEELNRLYLFLRSAGARASFRSDPTQFFQEIKASALHLQGITHATVVRNEGWRFIQAGKYIERADKTSRILDVRHAAFPARGAPGAITQAGALEWAAVLRSCSAWDAYQALHGAEILPAHVADLLLLSEDFPRSVRFSVQQLNTALRRISGVGDESFSNDAEKLSGRLLAELFYGTTDEIFDQGLHTYIDALQTKLNTIGEALFRTYILHAFQQIEDDQIRQQEEQQQQ
ncbi:alpha-E domain-containing protein [Termitidicoccus mucosus]|uniref:DUF403 domain-containing protein n=1 Tax=Termitidicoccus mucosus TaxID=1184151 RepID=A0A178IMW0_9BACT|nr:hypothetical protein AW736_06915 [Opitutaceae bacterium TSB47]